MRKFLRGVDLLEELFKLRLSLGADFLVLWWCFVPCWLWLQVGGWCVCGHIAWHWSRSWLTGSPMLAYTWVGLLDLCDIKLKSCHIIKILRSRHWERDVIVVVLWRVCVCTRGNSKVQVFARDTVRVNCCLEEWVDRVFKHGLLLSTILLGSSHG